MCQQGPMLNQIYGCHILLFLCDFSTCKKLSKTPFSVRYIGTNRMGGRHHKSRVQGSLNSHLKMPYLFLFKHGIMWGDNNLMEISLRCQKSEDRVWKIPKGEGMSYLASKSGFGVELVLWHMEKEFYLHGTLL